MARTRTIQVLRCQAQQAAMISDYDTEATARYLRLVTSPNYLKRIPTETPAIPFAARRDTNKGPVYELVDDLPPIPEPQPYDPGAALDSKSPVARLVWDLLRTRQYVYSTMPELADYKPGAGSLLGKLSKKGWCDYLIWKGDPRTKRYFLVLDPGPGRYPVFDVTLQKQDDWLAGRTKDRALALIGKANERGEFAQLALIDQALQSEGITLSSSCSRRIFTRLAVQGLVVSLPYVGACLPEFFERCDLNLRDNYQSMLGSRRLVADDVERQLAKLAPDDYLSFAERLADAAQKSKPPRKKNSSN